MTPLLSTETSVVVEESWSGSHLSVTASELRKPQHDLSGLQGVALMMAVNFSLSVTS
jgi:hypothetical protein